MPGPLVLGLFSLSLSLPACLSSFLLQPLSLSNSVLCTLGWLWTQYVAKDNFELLILLCHLLSVGIAGVCHQTQFILGKYSTN